MLQEVTLNEKCIVGLPRMPKGQRVSGKIQVLTYVPTGPPLKAEMDSVTYM